MTGHRPFSELSDGLRRRLADRDAERERIWHAINQAADEIRPTLFGSNLCDWLDRVARPLIFGDEFSAGGASTREGEGAGVPAEPPPVERGAGAANTGAPSSLDDVHENVVIDRRDEAP